MIQPLNPFSPANQISFGYKSVLKDEFRQGNLPTVKIDPMGSKLTKENVTLDHFIPHSKGGSSKLSNYLLMKDINNWGKGSKSANQTMTKEGLINYLKQFIDVVTGSFNGNQYIENVCRTSKRAGIPITKNEVLQATQQVVKHIDLKA